MYSTISLLSRCARAIGTEFSNLPVCVALLPVDYNSYRWKDRLSEDGLNIVQSYVDVGVDLETVAYADNETFVLYFPTGSG